MNKQTLTWLLLCVFIIVMAVADKFIFLLVGIAIVVVFGFMLYYSFRDAPTMPDDFEN